MKERILITGGAGFIGHITANKLVSLGYDVIVFDNLNKQVHPNPRESLNRLHPDVHFICGEIRDRESLQAALDGVDIVYHFVAETGVGQSMYEIERYSEVTIQGTAVLCDCIAKKKEKIKKIILSSSRAVYGEGQYICDNCSLVNPGPRSLFHLKKGIWDPVCPHCGAKIKPIPCKETSPLRPVSIYGITKRVQEDLICVLSKTYNIPSLILRYFNVFGPGQCVSNPYTGVLTIFANRMFLNKDIEIYEDGKMIRDFIPISDVISANIKALKLEISGVEIINLGTGKPRSILELAETLKKFIASRSAIKLTGRYRKGDIRHCFADISKASSLIGQPKNDSFIMEIENLVNWIQNNKMTSNLEKSIAELATFDLTGFPSKPNLEKRFNK